MRAFIIAWILWTGIPQPAQHQKQNSEPTENQQNAERQVQPVAPPFIVTTASDQKTADNKNLAQQKRWNYDDAVSPPTWSTWALVVIGFGATIAALLTLKKIERQTAAIRRQEIAMRRQNRIVSDTARRQLRAYVCVESGLLKFSESTIEGQIHIKNFGQTPAYEVRQWIHVWIEKWPLETTLPEPVEDFQMSSNVIPPSGKTIIVRQPGGAVGPAPEVTLGTTIKTVYVYGRVTYKDAFGLERWTNYRLIFGGRDGGRKKTDANGVLIGLLQPDTQGNDAN